MNNLQYSGKADGAWICRDNSKDYLYLRKTFHLASSSFKKTFLIADGENYEIYLNGKLVKGKENAREADTAEVTEYLTRGKNVIAARFRSLNSDIGFFACLCSGSSKHGFKTLLATGADWRCSDRLSKEWHSPGFNDSGWTGIGRKHAVLKSFAEKNKSLALTFPGEPRRFPELGPLRPKEKTNLAFPRLKDAKTLQASNNRLSLVVEYNRCQATFRVRDIATRETWFMPGPPFLVYIINRSVFNYNDLDIPVLSDDAVSAWDGHVSCSKTSKGIRVTTENFPAYPGLVISYALSLSGNMLKITLDPVSGIPENTVAKILFPLDFGASQGYDDGCLVNSFWQTGCRMFPFQPFTDRHGFRRTTGFLTEPELPFYGIVKHGHPCAFLINSTFREYVLQTLVDSNRGTMDNLYSITPVWILEAGRPSINDPRSLTCRFLEKGGYVEIAKTYRRHLIDTKRYVTLRERVKRNPVCNAIADASFFWGPYPVDKLPELMSRFKSMGVKKAVFHVPNRNDFVGAWKRWPEGMSTIYNTEKDFKYAADSARKLGYGFSPVDEFTVVADRGELYDERMRLMIHDGTYRWLPLEKLFLICERFKGKFMRKELPRVKKTIGKCPYLLDVEGCSLFDCSHPDHPLTYRESLALKRKNLSYIKKIFGCVTSEGAPLDCYTDIIDVGHYINLNLDYWGENSPGVNIPLWSLVYNGSVVNLWGVPFEGDAALYALLYGANLRVDLAELTIGGTKVFSSLSHAIDHISMEGAAACHKKITAAWPGRNFHELVHHEFLTPLVQMSRFREGVKIMEVVANFGDTNYRYRGRMVPPHDAILTRQKSRNDTLTRK